jgi:hypothetical protein
MRTATSSSADPIARRSNGTITRSGAADLARRRWALERRPDFGRRELDIIPTCDFEPFERARRAILRGTLDELTATFGQQPSGGIAAVARGWAWLVSFAEFYAVNAAKTGDPHDAERARRFFKDASIELARCHELMRAEVAARPKGRDDSPIVRAIREVPSQNETLSPPVARILAAKPDDSIRQRQ